MRPAPHRRGAPQLAISARPSRGRLRSHHEAMAGLNPSRLGFRMPAEWERHEGTWLAWPHERSDWPGKFAPIPWVYADIVRHLARVERVRILVQSVAERREARRAIERSGANLASVDFFVVPTNRGWIRDFGPIFIKKRGKVGRGAT